MENMTTIQLCSTKQVKFQASLTECISTYFLGNMEEIRNQESRAQRAAFDTEAFQQTANGLELETTISKGESKQGLGCHVET
jgi:hypothetical protein